MTTRSCGAKSSIVPKSNGKSRKTSPTAVRCRGCNCDLVKGSPTCVRVQIGQVSGIAHDIVDFDETHEDWGYMHIGCFLMAIGDPRALEVIANEAKKAAAALAAPSAA